MAHKERQTGEQLHTMGGFPLRLCGLAEISLTATASQSLLGLYWVRAIAKEQVANELQAVYFWEGHTHTRTHTFCIHSCTQTVTDSTALLKRRQFAVRSCSTRPLCTSEYIRDAVREMKMRTDPRRFGWMTTALLNDSPKQLRLIKLICHRGSPSSLVIRDTLPVSLSVCVSHSRVSFWLFFSICLDVSFQFLCPAPLCLLSPLSLGGLLLPLLSSAVPCLSLFVNLTRNSLNSVIQLVHCIIQRQ